MSRVRPAVHRVDANGNAGEPGRRPSQDGGLGAVHVHDVGSLAPEEGQQLDQAEGVAPGAERTADVLELDEARARSPRCVGQRALPVGGHCDVEGPDECRKQGSDVCLCAPGLGERDEEQDSWPLGGRS